MQIIHKAIGEQGSGGRGTVIVLEGADLQSCTNVAVAIKHLQQRLQMS